jgi:menaquinone-dependent protoporphyrinogen oxidase
MSRILVTYASLAGSTGEVARVVAEEIAANGAQVDVRPVDDVASLAGYDGVVIGAPMIAGWHRSGLRFLRTYRAQLQNVPVAVFVTAMSLTETGETNVGGIPVYVDEALPKPPALPGRLKLRERYAQTHNYVRPILRAAGPARPLSIGLFGGRLEYGRLPWWAVVFAMFIIQAPAGDLRNWPAIRAWAASLPLAGESVANPVPAAAVQP